MIFERLLEKLHVRSYFAKLITDAVMIALVISLGMVGILKLYGLSINPAIPAALGAATYAALADCGLKNHFS